jgi:hypothetical protein
METQLLREQNISPTGKVLEKALGESYPAFIELMEIIKGNKFGLVPEWKYYNDGKAWLCKVSYKKKTVFWLSVWEKFFKTGFYFTEKNCNGIFTLDIEDKIKKDFKQRKPIGKLLPLAISVTGKEQIEYLLKIIEYKKGLK